MVKLVGECIPLLQVEVLGETNPLTALVVNLTGVDPDDAFSVVPYEKGSTFLWYLEDIVGGKEKFEPFLKSYYQHFMHQSIDSFQFKQFFLNYFMDTPSILSIDWDAWFNKPGMPIYKPNFDQSLARVCQELKDRWVIWREHEEPSPFSQNDMTGFSSGQKIEFLSLLLQEDPLR